MILTINPNAALDRIFFIRHFHPEERINVERMVDAVGGKGLDTSVALQCLGVPNLALTFIAGSVGDRLLELLAEYGIHCETVRVQGDTRISNIIVETDLHRLTYLNTSGYQVTDEQMRDFSKSYLELLGAAGWVVMAGSLPPGAPQTSYRDWTYAAHERKVQVLVDCSGEPARQAALASPDILKMNRREFGETFNFRSEPLEALQEDLRKVRNRYKLKAVVVTCGLQGILAVVGEKAWLATCPPQLAVNAAGAGDAVSACLAWQLMSGSSWKQALRWGAAAGAAVTLTDATAEFHRSDLDRILADVTIREF